MYNIYIKKIEDNKYEVARADICGSDVKTLEVMNYDNMKSIYNILQSVPELREFIWRHIDGETVEVTERLKSMGREILVASHIISYIPALRMWGAVLDLENFLRFRVLRNKTTGEIIVSTSSVVATENGIFRDVECTNSTFDLICEMESIDKLLNYKFGI